MPKIVSKIIVGNAQHNLWHFAEIVDDATMWRRNRPHTPHSDAIIQARMNKQSVRVGAAKFFSTLLRRPQSQLNAKGYAEHCQRLSWALSFGTCVCKQTA